MLPVGTEPGEHGLSAWGGGRSALGVWGAGRPLCQDGAWLCRETGQDVSLGARLWPNPRDTCSLFKCGDGSFLWPLWSSLWY